MTDNFIHASLYALEKGLKEKVKVGILRDRLIVLVNESLCVGYVHEVDVEKVQKGEGEYIHLDPVNPLKIHSVKPEEYENYIHRVESEEEFEQMMDTNENKEIKENN